MKDFLLEIGCEEIPASYIEPALESMLSNILTMLKEANIEFGETKTYGTPRRLAIEIKNLAEIQKSELKEFIGPPVKASFDEKGKPTIAALKFAEKHNVPFKKVQTKKTDKGEYLSVLIKEKPLQTSKILSEKLAQLILSTQFPKTMKWGEEKIFFARPIQTILCLLDNKVIPFSLGKIKSSNFVLGHRFMANKKIKINNPNEYISKLKEVFVIADIKERKDLIRQEIQKVISTTNGILLEDEKLLDIVKNLVEYPFAILGNFSNDFLKVPSELLITAMREHQKYFSIIDKNQKLMPFFIAINNTIPKNIELVQKGHEKVLRARLTDAKFFYETDAKVPLSTFREKLKKVVFQAQIGTIYEKSLKIEELVNFLANELNCEKESLKKAAQYCKADLVSQAVIEFPKLQGIMGGIYAKLSGEKKEVADAIYEHYLPIVSGGALPKTKLGAVLSIADKIDTIAACFSIGLMPTGATDPYALRRQAIGIIQIIKDHKFNFSLNKLILQALSHYPKATKETQNQILAFFKNRMIGLEEENFGKDIVSGVILSKDDNILSIFQKINAFEKLKKENDFVSLVSTFKRVANIIKKEKLSNAVEISLLKEEAEKNLYLEFQKISQIVKEKILSQEFNLALLEIVQLKPFVDKFFDNVMVMAEDLNIKNNRISLLKEISDLFENFADWQKIEL